MWDLEAKIVSEVENIFVLLDTRKSEWIIENGQIVFANDSDLRAFNSYTAAIQKLAAKQEDLQKQNIQDLSNTLNKAKKLTTS